MPALLITLIALAAISSPASAARRPHRHTVCAVAPIEGVGLFRFCPVPARRR